MRKFTLISILLIMPFILFAQKSNNMYKNLKTKNQFIGKDANYSNGFNDGFYKYTGYKGIATGTFITSLLSPVLGLAPAIGGSSGDPRIETYLLPKNNQYINGYLQGAKSRRNRKIWSNYAIGALVSIGITAIIVASIKANSGSDYRQPGSKIPGF